MFECLVELLHRNNQHRELKMSIESNKVPYTDCEGNDVFVGDHISQTNFNGEPYEAIYEVVVSPNGCKQDGGFCLKMLRGNERAMKSGSDLSAFGSRLGNMLNKGLVDMGRRKSKQSLETDINLTSDEKTILEGLRLVSGHCTPKMKFRYKYGQQPCTTIIKSLEKKGLLSIHYSRIPLIGYTDLGESMAGEV